MADSRSRSEAHSPADTTERLLRRAQEGDTQAMDDLFDRQLPTLSRWARGRLPSWARDLTDTHDIVQETVFQAFRNLRGFEFRGKGALRAYLRQALINRIRNQMRRVSRRPIVEDLTSRCRARCRRPCSPGAAAGDPKIGGVLTYPETIALRRDPRYEALRRRIGLEGR